MGAAVRGRARPADWRAERRPCIYPGHRHPIRAARDLMSCTFSALKALVERHALHCLPMHFPPRSSLFQPHFFAQQCISKYLQPSETRPAASIVPVSASDRTMVLTFNKRAWLWKEESSCDRFNAPPTTVMPCRSTARKAAM